MYELAINRFNIYRWALAMRDSTSSKSCRSIRMDWTNSPMIDSHDDKTAAKSDEDWPIVHRTSKAALQLSVGLKT